MDATEQSPMKGTYSVKKANSEKKEFMRARYRAKVKLNLGIQTRSLEDTSSLLLQNA